MFGPIKIVFTMLVIASLQSVCAAETLRVQVSESNTGAPVGASVIVVGTEPTVISRPTDRYGVAVLDLPSLEWVSVTVRTDTHGVKCFGPGEANSGELIVNLQPAVRVCGVVSGSDRKPLKSAIVKVLYQEDSKCRIRSRQPDVVTNQDGKYELRNVDVGREFKIVYGHGEYGEHQITKDEVLSTAYGPLQTYKQVDVSLTK